MSLVDAFLDSPLAARLGWVFLHFLWQGALIAVALLAVTSLLGKPRARERYLASCVALGLMLVAPILTFFWVSTPDPEVSLTVLLAAMERGITSSTVEGTDWRALVPALTVFWLVGTLVQQTRLLVQWWGTQRLRRSFHLPLPTEWQNYVKCTARRLGIRVPVRAVESAVAEVPTVVGWLSPIVLVPTSALLQLNPDQLRMVLAHELAHIRRHDYLVNLVQTAVESLLFFHPAVWWISHRLRVEREYCCDDVAVALHGDALVYARALERLETLRAPASRGGEPRLVLASNGGSLMQRIQRLVRPESNTRKSVTLGLLPAVLLLGGALSSTAFGFVNTGPVGAQDEKEMSDAELERRIAELRRQIDRLEGRLEDLKGEKRGNVRFGHDEPHEVEVHVEPHKGRHEVHVEPHKGRHEVRVEPRVRKFDVQFGDGDERTIEIQIPEIRIPHIERFGPQEGRRFEVRIPEIRFGHGQDHEPKRFEFRIPDIDLEELHGELDVHLKEFDKHFDDLDGKLKKFDFRFGPDAHDTKGGKRGNVFFFSDDGEFDMKELNEKLQKHLHEGMKGVEWGQLHQNFDSLHEELGKLHTELDIDELHGHLQDVMKDVRIPDFEELEHDFRIELDDLDPKEIHRQIQENLKRFHREHGGQHGSKKSSQGMKFLFEIDADSPDGKARGYRWESRDGDEPEVWIWRADGEEEHSGHDEDTGVDWKRYEDAKDA